jgi:hypothetical protein
MKTCTTLAEYHDALARVPWGQFGPLATLPVARIAFSSPLAAARRQPRPPASTSARCPRCHAKAIVGRAGVICMRSAGGCGAMSPLTASQEATELRRALGQRGA